MRAAGDRYVPRSRLVSVEQTTNLGGGRVWPLQAIDEVLDVAARAGLRTHLDGARLLNAVVASGRAGRDYAGGFDTAWIDFSKGLGAPVGAVLAGSRGADRRGLALQADARRRAAPVRDRRRGLPVRARPPRRAPRRGPRATRRLLAEGLAELPAVEIDPATVETNIVIFEVPDAPEVVRRVADEVELQAVDDHRVRAVTHLDIGPADVQTALAALRRALG